MTISNPEYAETESQITVYITLNSLLLKKDTLSRDAVPQVAAIPYLALFGWAALDLPVLIPFSLQQYIERSHTGKCITSRQTK